MRALALVAAAAILVCHLAGIYALAARPMHYDENEYMHASWLMAAGKRIYRDFFEDHPPHLGIVLQSVRPSGDLHALDVRAWTIRARLLSGAFGTLAVLALMLFAWRATRSPAAPVVAAAMLLASSQMWSRGLTDIRAEAFTLALFWWGVVLLTWSRDAPLHAGAGIGLVFFANVWNPKWPLEAAFLGALYLHLLWRMRKERRALLTAIVPAIAIAAIALLPILTVTTPRDFLFFNFQFKAAVVNDFTSNPWIVRFFAQNSLWATAAPQHRWWLIVPAIILAAISANRQPPTANRRLAWTAIALAICALIELRFIYPYPYLWAQYLVMVATTASLVYALIAAHHRVIAYVSIVAATAFALVRLEPLAASLFKETPASWTRYWSGLRSMQGQTVWISPPRHPVAAYDASYYWYNFRESTPSMIRARAKYPEFIPPIGFGELPPCTLNARYVELGDWMPFLDGVCRCGESAFNGGRLAPTQSLGIFEVTTEKRNAPWLQRTRGLWSDLCRKQEVFLRGGQLNITP